MATTDRARKPSFASLRPQASPTPSFNEALGPDDLAEASRAIHDELVEKLIGEVPRIVGAILSVEIAALRKEMTTGLSAERASLLRELEGFALKLKTDVLGFIQNLPAPQITVNVPQQEAPTVNVTVPEAVINLPEMVVNLPEMKAAPITVNVPEMKAPDVIVNVPEMVVNVPAQEAPQITVNVPEMKVPDVIVNVPQQEAPTVNVTVPEVVVNLPASLPAEVVVNVPETVVNLPEMRAPDVVVNVPPPRRLKKTISYDEVGRPSEIVEEEVD